MKMPVSFCKELDKVCRDFLWDHDPGVSRIHPVGWDMVCRSKELAGGLGLLHDQMKDLKLPALCSSKSKLWQGMIQAPSLAIN